MKIEDFIALQKEFDSMHASEFNWDEKITDDNIEMLEFLLLSLFGEVGETANLVKKIVRGDFLLSERKKDIGEELADIFIYILKISYQLDIDLEKEYLKKLEKNKERFIHYADGENR